MKKITCLVPVGKGAIREEPLFYDLDGNVSKAKNNWYLVYYSRERK